MTGSDLPSGPLGQSRRILRIAVVLMGLMPVLGCSALTGETFADRNPARLIEDTRTSQVLRDLPPPARPLDVAIYDFPDLTGQFKPNDSFAENSRAVTQGADAMLIDVMTRAGGGAWFNVVERSGINNVLRERQIIQATRAEFEGQNAAPIPPLTFAGVLIEGGVVAYETNTRTGGIGARLLGVGARTEYQQDFVTVNLRVVSVSNGRVLTSVTTTKEIYSTLVAANVLRYVSSDTILEMDAGVTRNSRPQFAVREALELGVLALILQGQEEGLWSFEDPSAATEALLVLNSRETGERPSDGTIAAAADDT